MYGCSVILFIITIKLSNFTLPFQRITTANVVPAITAVLRLNDMKMREIKLQMHFARV